VLRVRVRIRVRLSVRVKVSVGLGLERMISTSFHIFTQGLHGYHGNDRDA